MNEYLSGLNWRYATKSFDATKKLSEEQVELLSETLRLSPSSFGLQPWKFYLITDPTIRESIKAAAWNQGQVTDASHLFAIASRTGLNEADVDAYFALTTEIQGVPAEKLAGYRDMIMGFVKSKTVEELNDWSARQSYLALGFLLSACAQNQIDSCPMEGFDAAAVTKLIGADADGYTVRALCPVGFRSSGDTSATRTKVRYPSEKILKQI